MNCDSVLQILENANQDEGGSRVTSRYVIAIPQGSG
jgi:hypothetical protein